MTSARFTRKQGQNLAFIHHYTLLHGCAPAELDRCPVSWRGDARSLPPDEPAFLASLALPCDPACA